MNIQHVSRSGKVYYLHGKPGKAGRTNFFFSTDVDGPLVDSVPAGHEIYENVAGQVFLRRIPKKLITDQELSLVRAELNAHAEEWIHIIEVKKDAITIHGTEGDKRENVLAAYGFRIDPIKEKQLKIQQARYLALLRFVLIDPTKRVFLPERFCFRGSVEDWIAVGPPGTLSALLKKYVKHLGKDSFYDLF